MGNFEQPITNYALDVWDSLEDEIRQASKGDLRVYRKLKPKIDAILRERNAACPDPGPDSN